MQKKPFSGSSLLRGFVLSSISMLLFCVGFFTLPFGMAALIFSPTPLALLGAREGKGMMTWGILGATLGLAFGFGPWFALSFLLGHGFLSLGLALPLGKLEKGSESLLFCIIISIASKLIFVAASVTLAGVNPFAIDVNMLQSMYPGMPALQGGIISQEQLRLAFPFFVITYSMFDSFINYKLCISLQRNHEVKFPPLPPFGEWRFPTSFVYVLVFAFVLPFIVEDNDARLRTMLELNLKSIVNIFFFIQGASVVWWGLSKLTADRFLLLTLPLRIVVLCLLLIPVLSVWVIALGLCDLCFDLRSRKIRRV